MNPGRLKVCDLVRRRSWKPANLITIFRAYLCTRAEPGESRDPESIDRAASTPRSGTISPRTSVGQAFPDPLRPSKAPTPLRAPVRYRYSLRARSCSRGQKMTSAGLRYLRTTSRPSALRGPSGGVRPVPVHRPHGAVRGNLRVRKVERYRNQMRKFGLVVIRQRSRRTDCVGGSRDVGYSRTLSELSYFSGKSSTSPNQLQGRLGSLARLLLEATEHWGDNSLISAYAVLVDRGRKQLDYIVR